METTVGKNLVATALGAVITPVGWIAVGTNGTTVTVGDTSLGTEIARVAATAATSGNVTTFTATFPAGVGTGTWQEAGLFNAANGGVMLSRVVFAAEDKLAGDSKIVTWAITQP
jgi:hypothetical protein